QSVRKRWIHGDETNLNLQIIFPISHEQIGLNGLTTHVAQTRSNKRHTKAGTRDGGTRRVASRTAAQTAASQNVEIKFAVLLTDSLNSELRQCELPRPMRHFSPQLLIRQHTLQSGSESFSFI